MSVPIRKEHNAGVQRLVEQLPLEKTATVETKAELAKIRLHILFPKPLAPILAFACYFRKRSNEAG